MRLFLLAFVLLISARGPPPPSLIDPDPNSDGDSEWEEPACQNGGSICGGVCTDGDEECPGELIGPEEVDFGFTQVGSVEWQLIEIENYGFGPLNIEEISISGEQFSRSFPVLVDEGISEP